MRISKIFLLHIVFVVCAVACSAQGIFPEPTKKVAPKYPPAALATETEGPVQVLVEVDHSGRVSAARALNGHPLLRKSAEMAAKEWIFSSQPGTHFITVTIIFQLSEKIKAEVVRSRGQFGLVLTVPNHDVLQFTNYSAID